MLIISDRIKMLRENNNTSQSLLAKKLWITRSSANTRELGISMPSTQYIIELLNIFHVSTDYLLCIPKTQSLDISGLTEENICYFSKDVNGLCYA